MSTGKVKNLQDLADLAGVSRATASRALNNSSLINAKTRNRLQQLAQKHHYTVNQKARDFRLRRKRVISVVFMFDIKSKQHMSDPFFLEMLGGIADCLADHDYDLLLAHAPVFDVGKLQQSRVFQSADGVIFVGQGEQHEALDALVEHSTPIVVWGAPVANRHYVLVGGDNEGGGYKATKHLLETGRQRIAFLGNTRNPEISARFSGFQRALAEAGIVSERQLVFDVPFDMENAREVTRRVLESASTFDALVCASDVVALAAISSLADLGLQVPQDVAVVGYDDIGLAAFSTPSLTTIRQNIRGAGQALVESILGLVNEQSVGDSVLPSELIVRQSSATAHPSANGPEIRKTEP